MDASLGHDSLFRRLCALLMVVLFVVVAAGAVHGGCPEEGIAGDEAEHVLFCKCACHHHLYIHASAPAACCAPAPDAALLAEPVAPHADAVPAGVFHPPKQLV
jgi:hypothetical protein